MDKGCEKIEELPNLKQYFSFVKDKEGTQQKFKSLKKKSLRFALNSKVPEEKQKETTTKEDNSNLTLTAISNILFTAENVSSQTLSSLREMRNGFVDFGLEERISKAREENKSAHTYLKNLEQNIKNDKRPSLITLVRSFLTPVAAFISSIIWFNFGTTKTSA
eukprot:maker-scaffold_5-snap-gene-14.2-mRNA-1 protein AED:0.00 eAED:0.00 QI:72/1/1/1/1/1/2/92/162